MRTGVSNMVRETVMFSRERYKEGAFQTVGRGIPPVTWPRSWLVGREPASSSSYYLCMAASHGCPLCSRRVCLLCTWTLSYACFLSFCQFVFLFSFRSTGSKLDVVFRGSLSRKKVIWWRKHLAVGCVHHFCFGLPINTIINCGCLCLATSGFTFFQKILSKLHVNVLGFQYVFFIIFHSHIKFILFQCYN